MSKVKITQHEGYYILWIDGQMWMWDLPEEIKIQQEIANKCYGRVLVAGYGLGIVQCNLEFNSKVTEVLTIEKEEKVIQVCKEHFHKIYGGLMILDFYDVIVGYKESEKFDCVVGDLWLEIHPDGLEQYKKFYQKAKTLIKTDGKILGWGSDYYEYLLSREGAKAL